MDDTTALREEIAKLREEIAGLRVQVAQAAAIHHHHHYSPVLNPPTVPSVQPTPWPPQYMPAPWSSPNICQATSGLGGGLN